MKYGVALLVLLVCGCEARVELNAPKPAEVIDLGNANTNRFAIKEYGKFWGGFGNHERELFVVTDKETGAEYLAITGCGVSELWHETRRTGKTQHMVTIEE